MEQEADSFKISANMPYIMLQKNLNVLVKLRKTFCGNIAKNCSKAHDEKNLAKRN